ncbi:MAG: thiamine phosphate synthase [Candidatus Methanoplasma sp.]|jgi:thiamine-phosphate pyrophosphorylase|nr:thiamine phosphate synthase [Candidatus Methanoplasma sp.]
MIIAITDRKNSLRPFLEQIEVVARSGPDMIILREKDLPYNEYTALAEKCARICSDHRVGFCVNSFTDTAVELGIRNIQLPLHLFIGERPFRGYNMVLVSVHSALEAVKAESLGADALLYGNVFETSCKPGASAKGIGALKEVCESVDIPVLGLGGINDDNIGEVIGAGVDGVCLMSGFMRAEDPSAMVRAYSAALLANARM